MRPVGTISFNRPGFTGTQAQRIARKEPTFGWNAKTAPNPDVVLTDRDFIDKERLILKPQALDRCIAKLLDENIGFVRIPQIERLFPDVEDREALINSLPLTLFERNPMAFVQDMAKNLPVHPHGQNLRKGFEQDPQFHNRLKLDYSTGYREHGQRFLNPDDDIYRGHYAHHEFTGEQRGDDQVVLLLTNGYWGFENIEGTEPMVMDIEEYRQDQNRKPGAVLMAKQPKVIGGDRDAVFPPGDPRLEYSYVSKTDYGKHADILILNNLRVGHGRMPGRVLPPQESMRRPLYQQCLTIGRYGRTPVAELIEEAENDRRPPTLREQLGRLFSLGRK